MIIPSLLYTVITILLALVDAIRVKIAIGKVPNISHKVSYRLAGILGGSVIGWWWYSLGLSFTWCTILAVALVSVGFVGIRLALYDPVLNAFRLLMGINPTGRIDYESPTTSSYVDNHSRPMPFWMKRFMGATGWLLMFLLYKVIFKV